MSPLPSDMVPPQQDYLLRRIAALERQVKELAAARGLASSTVSQGGVTFDVAGGLRVMHDNGVALFEIGTVQTLFGPVERMLLRRRNGTFSLQAGSNLFGFEFVVVQDNLGNIIFSDDGTTGQGLGYPYLGGQFVSVTGVPTDTTAGGVFVPLQRAVWRKQQPRIQFRSRINVTSTTAEIRYRLATGADVGTILGGVPFTLGTGIGHFTHGPFTMPGNHLDEIEIDIEGRVATGAGVVGACVMSAIGLGS